tara:strand:- start:58 stop:279 length:222 start_codon:yes stop_codon:yes gene_type:complete
MMTYALAFGLPDRIASIAPVASAALLGFNEVPSFPISIMEFHGTGEYVFFSSILLLLYSTFLLNIYIFNVLSI